jgi:isopentenyl-diphosphate Delta-isomerase
MIEYVDVLTSDGHPTGARIPKAEAHRTGAWHRAAHLWLLTPQGEVLLQKRADAKDNWPGWWDVSVAGHVAAGETSIETVIRETREELGLEISEATYAGSLREQCVLHDGAYVDNELHDIFVATREIDIAVLVLDPAEVAAVALVTPEEARRWRVVPSSLRSLAFVC